MMLTEIKPTLLRLFKIVWSQTWRLTLVTFVLFYICDVFHLPCLNYENRTPFRHIHDPLIIQLIDVSVEYIFELLGFFLIMGTVYKDFIFDFNPKFRNKTKAYWESLACISWAYTWRAVFYEYSATLLFTLTTLSLSSSSMEATRILMSLVARAIILNLIVNKKYGNARISLLGKSFSQEQ